jgi:hypothetical protein
MTGTRSIGHNTRRGRLAVIPLTALGLAAGALSACSTSATPGVAHPPVAITVSLQHTKVAAGTVIPGVATLTNNTVKTITVETCAWNGWLDVGLTTPSIPYRPGNGAVGCPPTVHLKPGRNHFAIKIWTTYLACTPHRTAVSQKEDLPLCVPRGMPALPAGHYVTSIAASGLPPNTSMPKPTAVTLLPPTGVAWSDEVFSAAALPPGATPTSAALPTLRGSGTYLPDEVDVHRLFLVPGTRASVASYILDHLPPGASNNQGITVQTDPVSYDAEFIPLTMPTKGPNENRATLSYAFAADGPGVQELRIDALTSSVPTRPASEMVARTGRVRVTGFGQSWLSGGTSNPVSVTLTGAKAAELRSTFNRLGLGVSPGCMEYAEGYTIEFFGHRHGSRVTATGSFCAGDNVGVATGHRSGYGLSDPHCTLLEEVVSNLPPRAAPATRSDLRECRLVYVG